ncbi:MAG TPA: hypothetical protein VFO19_19085 [Vicinamibacterales bacterium]|nr:hypothetical protein [Vicinamibacterales bacterium]
MKTLAPGTSLVMRSVPVVGATGVAGGVEAGAAGVAPDLPRAGAVARGAAVERGGGVDGAGPGASVTAAAASRRSSIASPLHSATPTRTPPTSRPPAAMAIRRPGIVVEMEEGPRRVAVSRRLDRGPWVTLGYCFVIVSPVTMASVL